MENFEDKLKQQLDKVEKVDIPEIYLWENMDIRVPLKKKRKKFFFWLFPLAIAGVLLWFAINSSSDGIISNESTSHKENKIINHTDNVATILSSNTITPIEDQKKNEIVDAKTKITSNSNLTGRVIPRNIVVSNDLDKTNTSKLKSTNDNDHLFDKRKVIELNHSPSKTSKDETPKFKVRSSDRSDNNSNSVSPDTGKSNSTLYLLDGSLSYLPLLDLLANTNTQRPIPIPKPILYPIENFDESTKVHKCSWCWLIGLKAQLLDLGVQSHIANAESLNTAISPYWGYGFNVSKIKTFANSHTLSVGATALLHQYTFRNRAEVDRNTTYSLLRKTTSVTYRRVVLNNSLFRIGLPVLASYSIHNTAIFDFSFLAGLTPLYTLAHKGELLNDENNFIKANDILTDNFTVEGSFGLQLTLDNSRLTVPISLRITYDRSLINNTYKYSSYSIGLSAKF